MNNFINREEGHKILAVSSSDTSKYLKNRIYISRPAYLDVKKGDITEESWYTTFKTNIENETQLDSITTFDTGRFINLSLQNIYFFKITTKEQFMVIESERV
jgi:hypothetical protein